MAAAAGTNAIYLVGGGVARGGSDAAVFIARLDGTGAITGYDPAGALPAARSSASAAVVNGRLFVVGGIFDGSDKSCSSSTIISAPIEAGGRLGSWSGNTSLPKPPQGAALAVSGNTLLLVGGISNYGDAAGSVLAATVEADGSLTQWKRIATLKDNRYGHGAAVVGGSLYVLGGNIDSTTLSSEAFSAKVSIDGAASCN
jgi:N-acetylneuraminic acid mutarotase